MEFINKVEIKGTVGNVRFSNFGNKQMARISVATNHAYKDQDGNAVIETTWHNIIAWENEKNPFENLQKGAKIHIVGRLRMQKYTDASGAERVSPEILANKLSVV